MGVADGDIRKWSGTGRCSTGACAEAETVPGGVRLTSTIPGTGELTYTAEEFRTLVTAAKGGELDHLL